MKRETISMGKMVLNEIKAQEYSIPLLAKRIGVHKSSLYKMIRNDSFKVDVLKKLSKILQRDFFRYYVPDHLEQRVYEELKAENDKLKEQNKQLEGEVKRLAEQLGVQQKEIVLLRDMVEMQKVALGRG